MASYISHTGQALSRAVTFQFALDPNAAQKILFIKCAGARRFTFNHHLARVKANLDAREIEQKQSLKSASPFDVVAPSLSWSGYSFINEFNAWKSGRSDDALLNEDGTKGIPWRHELPGDVFECASVDAAHALENFTASRKDNRIHTEVGFPRLQAKGKVTPSFRLRNRAASGALPLRQTIRFRDPSHLRLPKVGPVKLFGSTRKVRRMIENGRFHLYSVTLNQRGGRWIASLTGVASELHYAKRSHSSRHAVPVGVDRGIKSLCVAADANGEFFGTFEGVKSLREALVPLKAANRALARTTPGSRGHERARRRLAKIHQTVANRRRHQVHQTSNFLVNRAQVLVLEDLNFSGMVRNRRVSRAVSDAGMGQLFRQIRYKAQWHDVEVRVADRFFASSKICSGCGGFKDRLSLAERTYCCEHCGLSIDRDLNAAVNLARWQPKEPAVGLAPTPMCEPFLAKLIH